MRKVFVILGPTSTGKTSTAINLCKKYDGEVVSADSRQVYKFMDVGTGKKLVDDEAEITKSEKHWVMDGIKIWGYDLVTPNDYFSSYDFAQFALKKLEEILTAGKTAFLVGGTGFYIDMVTGRIKPANIPPDFDLRHELEHVPLEELQEKLQKLDKTAHKKIDKNNPARLIRAIEKILTKNKPSKPLNYLENTEYILIELTADRETLYEKADNWLEKIWEHGLLEEVESLLNSEYKDSPKLQGLVYDKAISYVKGELPEDEAKQKIKYDLHSYIRRQQTYFKKIPGINTINTTQDNKLQKVYNIIDG